jgi:16S rRNA processing protein RimM
MVDEVMGEIGQIETVLEYPNQNVFQVFKDKKEILIPIRDEIIKKVDRKKKTITILAPEGLIDLYLNS